MNIQNPVLHVRNFSFFDCMLSSHMQYAEFCSILEEKMAQREVYLTINFRFPPCIITISHFY